MYVLIQLRNCFIYFVVVGLLSHVFGELLPREKFHYDRPPYRPLDWEENGSFYSRVLHIRKWRHLLPDKSKAVKSMYQKKLDGDFSSKHLGRLLEESCVAEFVHCALIAVAPFVALFADGACCGVCMVLFMVGNVPFVIIQRYNRPKLARLLVAAQKREELLVVENECDCVSVDDEEEPDTVFKA